MSECGGVVFAAEAAVGDDTGLRWGGAFYNWMGTTRMAAGISRPRTGRCGASELAGRRERSTTSHYRFQNQPSLGHVPSEFRLSTCSTSGSLAALFTPRTST